MGWQNILKNTIGEAGVMKEVEATLAEEYKEWSTTDVTVDGRAIHLIVQKGMGPHIACKITDRDGKTNMDEVLRTGANKIVDPKKLDAYIKVFMEMVKPTYRSLNWFYEVAETTNGIEIQLAGVLVEGKYGNIYRINTESLKSSGCYEVTTDEGYDICIEIAEEKPAGDNLLGLALGLLNDEQSSESIEGLTDYLSDSASVDCRVCSNYNEIQISEEQFTCNNCQATTTLTNIQFAPGFEADYEVEDAQGPDGRFQPEYSHHTEDIFFVGNKLFRINSPEEFDLTVRNSPELILEPTNSDIWIYDRTPYNEEGYELDMYEVQDKLLGDDDFIKFAVEHLEEDMGDIYHYLEYVNLSGNLWADDKGEFLDGDGNVRRGFYYERNRRMGIY